MAREFLKPAKPGTIVRDPITYRALKAEGEWKTISSHWVRRKRAGEVIEASPPAAHKPSKDTHSVGKSTQAKAGDTQKHGKPINLKPEDKRGND